MNLTEINKLLKNNEMNLITLTFNAKLSIFNRQKWFKKLMDTYGYQQLETTVQKKRSIHMYKNLIFSRMDKNNVNKMLKTYGKFQCRNESGNFLHKQVN